MAVEQPIPLHYKGERRGGDVMTSRGNAYSLICLLVYSYPELRVNDAPRNHLTFCKSSDVVAIRKL